MNLKRTRIIALVCAVCALLVWIVQPARVTDPTYKGKPLSLWFKEYAYSSNAPPAGLYVFSHSANANVVRWMGGVSNLTPAGISPLGTLRNQPIPWPGDPSLDALQAFGSNAVPYLVRQLRYGRLDRAYTTAFTNLPHFVQRKLPNPGEKHWYRIRAMDALGNLKESAQGATPALLALLHQGEPRLRSRVLTTLRQIYADSFSISGLLLQLGEQQRYAEVLEIAHQTKWQGREVAHLFGEILQATNTALHRDAISLLEESGERAAPALDSILAALRSSDGEVRYLAARAVENIGRRVSPETQPRIAAALEASLNDEKDSVRNVAQRALAKLNNSAEAPVEASRRRHPEEVEHEEKKVEQWFQEYVSGAATRTPPHAPPVVNGELLWPSPAAGQRDPAWEAFNAMGSNAVPWLVNRVVAASARANNSKPSRLERRQAIELIHRLGTKARSAAPALLALLSHSYQSDEDEVCAAIASVRPEPQLINQFLLDLGKWQRNADMIYYAQQLGWSGSEVAQRLGSLLRSPDRKVSHDAAALLEAAGPGAQAAVEQIADALQNTDQEIRYLAARSLASMATNSPAARKALRGLIDDQNEMVRKVARQAIVERPHPASGQQ